MNPARRTALVRKLLRWYRSHARDLPWRRTRDPYRVWLSEIMLQQTRVETVQDYYHRFTEAFPGIEDLAAASEDRVLKLWEGLGYYSRARNLLKAARWVVRESGGSFPEDAGSLQALPGVGRYTAGAIASIAFGERTPVLDGNVKRVLARLFAVRESIDTAAAEKRLWALADTLVSARAPGDSNQALMELGARICTPRRPGCEVCPAEGFCEARASGLTGILPVRKARKPVPHHPIVAAAMKKNGRYLFGRRPSEGMLGGLWEFPGGKVESGESHAGALVREVREELGLDVEVGDRIASVNHAYTHFKITLYLYGCKVLAGKPEARYHTSLKWMRPADFRNYAFPAATLRLFPELGVRECTPRRYISKTGRPNPSRSSRKGGR